MFEQPLQGTPREIRKHPARANVQRFLLSVITLAVLALCTFAVFDAGRAAVTLIRRTQPATGFNALFEYPWWGMVHFLPGLVFVVLGPFQFWKWFRNHHRRIHRWFGRFVFGAGLALALSGITFPFTMPERPVSEKAFFCTVFLLFLYFLIKAFSLARRRQFALHFNVPPRKAPSSPRRGEMLAFSVADAAAPVPERFNRQLFLTSLHLTGPGVILALDLFWVE